MMNLSRPATLALMLGLGTPALAEPPVLDGHWVSAAPEAQGPLFATRDFTFDGDGWSVLYSAYGDQDATAPLFTLEVGGHFVLGGPSATVEGATEGVFPATHRRISAQSEAGAAMFAGMGCTLMVGEAKDLTTEGCGFVPSLMSAMGEYDLVAVRDGQLFFGDRSGDLTKARPTALTPYPLVRR